jgi:hypothetical protein
MDSCPDIAIVRSSTLDIARRRKSQIDLYILTMQSFMIPTRPTRSRLFHAPLPILISRSTRHKNVTLAAGPDTACCFVSLAILRCSRKHDIFIASNHSNKRLPLKQFDSSRSLFCVIFHRKLDTGCCFFSHLLVYCSKQEKLSERASLQFSLAASNQP